MFVCWMMDLVLLFRCLRKDRNHFTAGTSSKYYSFKTFGKNFDKFHVVGFAARCHFSRYPGHIQNDQF